MNHWNRRLCVNIALMIESIFCWINSEMSCFVPLSLQQSQIVLCISSALRWKSRTWNVELCGEQVPLSNWRRTKKSESESSKQISKRCKDNFSNCTLVVGIEQRVEIRFISFPIHQKPRAIVIYERVTRYQGDSQRFIDGIHLGRRVFTSFYFSVASIGY